MGQDNKKTAANAQGLSQNQAVVYGILIFSGGAYFENKHGELQLPGKKISQSDDPAEKLKEALFEKFGIETSAGQLKAVSSKNYADHTNGVKSQKCYVYKLELEKAINCDDLGTKYFLVGIEAIKNGIEKHHGLNFKEITKKIVKSNC